MISRRQRAACRAVRTAAFGTALLLVGGHARSADDLVVFTLQQGRFEAPPGAPSGPLPIGSLVKPFIVQAWARAHPHDTPPVHRCLPASRCWSASGHGTVGLVRAVAISCNTYFRALAAETDAETLLDALRAAGFRPPDPLTPEAAIGLPTRAGLLAGEPETVLRAYATLVREPWAGADALRRTVLAGLRASAREGTAAALERTGLLAKTGTVPALDGRPLATSGWALAIDETGRGYLALLPRGDGRGAARALARWLGTQGHPTEGGGRGPRASLSARAPHRGSAGVAASAEVVRVALFEAVSPRRILARNLGAAPVATNQGFVGPGGVRDLRPGDQVETGLWDLSVPAARLHRVVRGALHVHALAGDVLKLRCDMEPIEYVAGVIAAELPHGDAGLRTELGAAVLRFLREPPRHGDADRCDLTHCAFFVGRGPRPGEGGSVPSESRPSRAAIGDEEWTRMLEASREPGPVRWTSHCGGEPLSPHAVWGGGDTRVHSCPRHRGADSASWIRVWSRRDVERAFGAPVSGLRVGSREGRWRLLVTHEQGEHGLSWDEAHARLAGVLGWGALPSPADRVTREGERFRAAGRGLGHRVGLCLGGGPATDHAHESDVAERRP